MPPRRLTQAGIARLAGVSEATVARWMRGGRATQPFPTPGDDGKWDRGEVRQWLDDRPGRGAAGTEKPRTGSPCQKCGTVVPRRKLDPVTGLLVCKPCYITGGKK